MLEQKDTAAGIRSLSTHQPFRTAIWIMGSVNYHKCIACRKSCCNKNTAKKRVDWAMAKKDGHPISECLTRPTMAGFLKEKYELSGSLDRDIVRNAYNMLRRARI